MGDPRKRKKSYDTPMHPWQKERIDYEKKLIREFGLKNKQEVWKSLSRLKNFINHIKGTGMVNAEQADKEKTQVIEHMVRMGYINKTAKPDDILALGVETVLERRLQTLVFRKKLARSMKQARQFIVHRHILVDGKVVTAPSYIVPVAQEATLSFIARSPMFDEKHPERAVEETQKNKKAKAEAKTEAPAEEVAQVGEKA